MKRIEMRGLIVHMSLQGDAHRRVGLYTEEGMHYFTIYGAKSTKGHLKSSLALFTMGHFIFTLGKQHTYNFVDAHIFEHSLAISNNIEAYYAACSAAEIVKTTVGAEHELQFKTVVNFILYLIDNADGWRGALILFLWRCLVHNGWQPDIPPLPKAYVPAEDKDNNSTETATNVQSSTQFSEQTVSTNYFLRYTFTEGFLWASAKDFTTGKDVVEYIVIESLINSNTKNHKEYSDMVNSLDLRALQKLINILFTVWQHSLGHKLTLSEFMVH